MRVEVRRNEDQTLDEVVLWDENERCIFHLEQMSENRWWMACYPEADNSKDIHIDLFTHRTQIYGEAVHR